MNDWSKAGVEPSVADILSDPIVHLMMQRDGVALDDMRTLIHAARMDLLASVGAIAPAGDLAGRLSAG